MIRRLPEHVINKIAAGQVIQRPVNGTLVSYTAIKQLIENSIDAGAKNISIILNEGGLKLIKIIDDGKGIDVEDFPLLCARFATSKISELDDLKSLGSFGFRGEALASLSYVTQLSISSRNHKSNIGYTAYFRNEKLEEGPTQTHQTIGTKISAVNLFANLQSRRRSLNPVEQKKRIIKLLCHFCLHYSSIKFTLQSEKGNEPLPTVLLDRGQGQAKMSIFQQITKLPFEKMTYMPKKKLTVAVEGEGIITKLNACKGKNLLLNINNRIIENQQIYKAIEKAYSQCYQSIHSDIQCFYVYLSVKIQPKNIDCNVHPTKKNVGFFAGKQIYEAIHQWILSHIKEQSVIKMVKPAQQTPTITQIIRGKLNGEMQETKQKFPNKTNTYDYNKKRTDNTQLPLQYFLEKKKQTNETQGKMFKFPSTNTNKVMGNNKTRQLFKELVYVGCMGLNYVFVQRNNKLYMMNIVPYMKGYIMHSIKTRQLYLKQISGEHSIQEIVKNFIQKNEQIEIQSSKAIDWIHKNSSWIFEHYGIKIQQLYLKTYPCIHSLFVDYTHPNPIVLTEIAYLLCRVYHNSIKKEEEQKRDDFLSDFLCSQFENQFDQIGGFNSKYSQYLENTIMPSLKTNSYREKEEEEMYMKEMVDLKDLYKIFQRC